MRGGIFWSIAANSQKSIKMKKLYMEILEILSQDSRYSAAKIATMLGVSEKEIKESILDMEKKGIIVKYTTLVNTEKLDKEVVKALIEVRVTPQKCLGFDAIAKEIYAFSEVESVYLMSGGYDLCVVISGSTLKEVASFVSEKLSVMDTVVSTATHFILKRYKQDGTVIEEEGEPRRLVVNP